MKLFIVNLVLVSLSFFACKKSEYGKNITDCVRNSIEASKSREPCGVASVDEYEYQGVLVYVFNPDNTCSDAITSIIKADCTTLCGLGGIAGFTMCNGERFYDKAVYSRTVWKK